MGGGGRDGGGGLEEEVPYFANSPRYNQIVERSKRLAMGREKQPNGRTQGDWLGSGGLLTYEEKQKKEGGCWDDVSRGM